jgi:hypothetical protein
VTPKRRSASALGLQRDISNTVRYGEALADCLFPFNIRQRFFESLRLLKEDEALRVRLKFDAWQLADLAWEYVYVAKSGGEGTETEIDGFVALDRRISIVRYEYTDYPPIPFDLTDGSLVRLVMLLSSPSDFPPLDLEREFRSINVSLLTGWTGKVL